MINNNEYELGWEDIIQQDSEFLILEPGEYWFTVKNFERSRHTPSPNNPNPNKLPACNKAILELDIFEPKEGKTKTVKHTLFLHSRTEGMLSAFFGAIGQKKHGENLQMNWHTVIGSVGVCTIKKSISSNGNEFNEVGYMIYKDDVDTSKQLNSNPKSQQTAYQGPPIQTPQAQVQQTQQVPYQAPQQSVPQQQSFQPGQF